MDLKKSLAALTAAVTVMSSAAAVFATDYTTDPNYPLPPGTGSNNKPNNPNNNKPNNNPNNNKPNNNPNNNNNNNNNNSKPNNKQTSDSSSSYNYSGPVSNPSSGGSGSGKPSTNSNKTNTSNTNNKDKNSSKETNAPATLIDKVDVTDLSSGKPISASYKSAEIKSAILALLARTNMGKLFISTKRYDIIIDSRSITEVKDINLGMQMTKNTKAGAMIIRTMHRGEYGCTVNMIISSKYYSQCKVNLNKAKVYYVDEGGAAHVMGKVILDDTGNIVLPMTFGGKYIIK